MLARIPLQTLRTAVGYRFRGYFHFGFLHCQGQVYMFFIVIINFFLFFFFFSISAHTKPNPRVAFVRSIFRGKWKSFQFEEWFSLFLFSQSPSVFHHFLGKQIQTQEMENRFPQSLHRQKHSSLWKNGLMHQQYKVKSVENEILDLYLLLKVKSLWK